jgi:hypothetical protein
MTEFQSSNSDTSHLTDRPKAEGTIQSRTAMGGHGYVPRFSLTPKPGFFGRILRRKSALGQVVRKPCCLVAVLIVLDRGLALDGMIMAVNDGGMLFRQASVYIFDRQGSEISLRFGESERRGRIINVGPDGYWVQFHEQMNQVEINFIINSYGTIV